MYGPRRRDLKSGLGWFSRQISAVFFLSWHGQVMPWPLAATDTELIQNNGFISCLISQSMSQSQQVTCVHADVGGYAMRASALICCKFRQITCGLARGIAALNLLVQIKQTIHKYSSSIYVLARKAFATSSKMLRQRFKDQNKRRWGQAEKYIQIDLGIRLRFS